MDAAAKPPRTGLRRPPQPDPPCHPTECQLLTLLWLPLRLRRVQGAALPSNTPS
ncbi:MAG: 16S rRNA (guanine(966)-N(2))-methyltransferase RsmD, partial [Stenotrophomonas maltophilia]